MREARLGLIETLRVRDGRIPFLERHLERLSRSLAELRLARPTQNVRALATPFADTGDAVLRVEVTDGRATVTVRELPPLAPPTVITAAEPHVGYAHKTTVRDCFDEAMEEAEIAEADDALLLTHEGWVAEGTVWSLFWWDGASLHSPALDLDILPGVGRARVSEVAAPSLRDARVRRDALAGKSLFLVNSVRGIVEIARLDGVVVPSDPRTRALADRFWPSD